MTSGITVLVLCAGTNWKIDAELVWLSLLFRQKKYLNIYVAWNLENILDLPRQQEQKRCCQALDQTQSWRDRWQRPEKCIWGLALLQCKQHDGRTHKKGLKKCSCSVFFAAMQAACQEDTQIIIWHKLCKNLVLLLWWLVPRLVYFGLISCLQAIFLRYSVYTLHRVSNCQSAYCDQRSLQRMSFKDEHARSISVFLVE